MSRGAVKDLAQQLRIPTGPPPAVVAVDRPPPPLHHPTKDRPRPPMRSGLKELLAARDQLASESSASSSSSLASPPPALVVPPASGPPAGASPRRSPSPRSVSPRKTLRRRKKKVHSSVALSPAADGSPAAADEDQEEESSDDAHPRAPSASGAGDTTPKTRALHPKKRSPSKSPSVTQLEETLKEAREHEARANHRLEDEKRMRAVSEKLLANMLARQPDEALALAVQRYQEEAQRVVALKEENEALKRELAALHAKRKAKKKAPRKSSADSTPPGTEK